MPEVVAKARAQAADSGRNLRIAVAGALVQAGTVSPAPTPPSVASTPQASTSLSAPAVPMPSPASRMIPAHRDGVDVLAQALAENIHRTALKTVPDRGGILRVRVYPSL